MSKIVILGATSAIAEQCARLWAVRRAQLHLMGRNAVRLEQVAADLRLRGAERVSVHVLDLRDRGALAHSLAAATADGIAIDAVLVAQGTLPDQARAESDADYAGVEFDNNATSVIAAITMLAQIMQGQGAGTIAVISSVAGDRGRASNHLYGAAKGAVNIYCDGLRARLFARGVHVLTVKPGFVDTPMTAGLALPGLLVASPDRVARDILRGIDLRRSVIYTPFWWRFIMLVIRFIPEPLFKRIKL
jgi:short-subunit dehydrogenase